MNTLLGRHARSSCSYLHPLSAELLLFYFYHFLNHTLNTWGTPGRVRVNQYLQRISKIESSMCECDIEEQAVEHVLMRCVLAEDARHQSLLKLGMEMNVEMLLYSQEGVEETAKIWKEFEQERKGIRERRGEEAEMEDREMLWGWGGVERWKNVTCWKF